MFKKTCTEKLFPKKVNIPNIQMNENICVEHFVSILKKCDKFHSIIDGDGLIRVGLSLI